MDRTLKAISLVLSYPTSQLQEAMADIGGVLAADRRLTAAARRDLRPLVNDLASRDIYALEEEFVNLFDRSRTLSLNLFEHVHGESRDRGTAMVDLVEMYREAGFEPTTTELPDHLPVLLEYLSIRPEAEVREILADAGHIFVALKERLERRKSVYAAAFEALNQLAGAPANPEAADELRNMPDDDPDDLEALDQVWEETEVTFGPDPNAGCPVSRDLLARMAVPPAPQA